MRLRSIISNARIPTNLRFLLCNYKYAPLPSPTCIRLLEIAPCSEKSILRCSLNTFELQEAPSFRALSYTWGDSQVQLSHSLNDVHNNTRSKHRTSSISDSDKTGKLRGYSIICDGRLIKVMSNLRGALRMLAGALHMPHMPKTPVGRTLHGPKQHS